MFEHLEPYAGDPILGLNDAFQKDPRADKVNLSIGIYFDDAGRIPVLDCVRQAEAQMLATSGPKPYLPIEGSAAARAAVQGLLFGAAHEALRSGRVATIQTVGSSGGLRVGADFIKHWLPGSALWVSDPTWDNHRAMFEGAGIAVHSYPYYDAATGGLQFDAMLATVRTLPPRSVVLLHACCHNPTGVDLSPAQWDALIPVLRDRELLPYLDMAYQGYGDGIDEDAFAVTLVGQVQIGQQLAGLQHRNQLCPLLARQVHPCGVVAASVQQHHAARGQRLQRGQHVAEPQTTAGRVVVRVGVDADTSAFKHGAVVVPRRVTDPQRAARQPAFDEIRAHFQPAAGTHGLQRGDAAALDRFVSGAKQQLLHRAAHGR